MIVLVLSYAVIKAIDVYERKNPVINILTLPNGLTPEQASINIQQSRFRIAFGIEDVRKKTLKDDERYVRYIVRHYGKIDGKPFQRILPVHNCTASEMSEFFPISSHSEREFDQRIEDGVYRAYCVDWDKELNIKGQNGDKNVEKFEVIFSPCNYIHTSHNYKDRPVPENCIADLDEQKKYLNNIQLTLLFNNQEFNQ